MTYVYFAPLPDGEIGAPLLPEARWLAVKDIKNDKVKKEKYFAWRLLEYGLSDSFGLTVAEAALTVGEFGRWSSPYVFFSISHSSGALAVAISDSPCGIDIEPECGRWSEELAKRYLNDEEYARYSANPEASRREEFLKIWTTKEAIFKASGKEHFSPRDTDTASHEYKTIKVTIGEGSYIASAVFCGDITVKHIDL